MRIAIGYIEEPKLVSMTDCQPKYIEDQKDVLDDLGLTEERQKMDAAHNEMMQKKFALLLQLSHGLAPQTITDPFDLDEEQKPSLQDERIAAIARTSTLKSHNYREAAKEFLEAVIPAATDREKELDREIAAADRELRETVAKLEKKKAAAIEAKKAFRADLYRATWEKFNMVNRCQYTDGENTWEIENAEDIAWSLGTVSLVLGQLGILRDEIEAIERDNAAVLSGKTARDFELANTREAVSHWKEKRGAAPIGGVMGSSSDAGALKSLIGNFFK